MLHSMLKIELLSPPLSENELADGVSVGWNVNVSEGLPPLLILATDTFPYVAWAACAHSARPSHAIAAASSSRMPREARMDNRITPVSGSTPAAGYTHPRDIHARDKPDFPARLDGQFTR